MAASSTSLSSVRNAVRVLKSFSSTEREWGVSELARRLDLSKSTAHRVLVALTEEGMLEQNTETGRYRLGLAVFDLAAAVPTQFDLHEAVLWPMTDLRNRTGLTVQVGVLDRREVVYIERLDSPATSKLFLEIGRRNWAHSTASGKVLLAHLPRPEQAAIFDQWELATVTVNTITDLGRFRAQLEQVRRLGYAENRAEATLGVHSVAAPIRDQTNRVIAALSVVGPTETGDGFDNTLAINDQRLVFATMEAAAKTSRRLGHRGLA